MHRASFCRKFKGNFYNYVPVPLIRSTRTRYAVTISPPEMCVEYFYLLMDEVLDHIQDHMWAFVAECTDKGRYHLHGLYVCKDGIKFLESVKELYKDMFHMDIKVCYDVHGWLRYMFKEVPVDARPLYATNEFKRKAMTRINKFKDDKYLHSVRITSFGDILSLDGNYWTMERMTSYYDSFSVLFEPYKSFIEEISIKEKIILE